MDTTKTVMYNHIFDGPKLRPNSRLPLSSHKRMSDLLKNCKSELSDWVVVRDAVDLVRRELDEWLLREYAREELGQDNVPQMYYGRLLPFRRGLPDYASLLKWLKNVQQDLTNNYPVCGPVNELFFILQDAIEIVREEQSKEISTAPEVTAKPAHAS